MRRSAVILAVAVLALVARAPTAGAHASLASSDPADGATVPTAPDHVTLTFTEPPDPKLSSVEVLDAGGTPVQEGEPQPVPGDDRSLRVALPADLPDGVYTVSWTAVSETDGHFTAQAFAFGVGSPTTAIAPVGGAGEGTPSPSVLSVAAKTGLYAGLALLLAAGVLGLVLFGGAVPGGRRTLLAGAVLAPLGAIGIVLAERSTLGIGLGDLVSSNTGGPLVRVVVAAVLAGVAAAVVAVRRNRGTLLALAATAAATMLMRAWSGHAGGSLLEVALQWGHFLAIGTWIGGLALLAIRLPSIRTGSAPVEEIRRFSRIAGWSLLAVAVTGALRALNELGGAGQWHRIFEGSYGLTLLIKLGVAAALVALGASNRYRTIPAIERGERLATFEVVLRAEVVLAVGIFVLTGVLTGLPPQGQARGAASAAPTALVATGNDFATTMRVRLTLTPGTVGRNTFRVLVTDYDTGAPLEADRVSLRFEPLTDPGVGASTLELARSGDAWQATGTQLGLAGPWRITVLVQRAAGGTEIPLEVRPRLTQTTSVTSTPGLPDITTMTLPGGVAIQAYADPGTDGQNDLHVTAFDPAGRELPLRTLAVSADGPDAGPQALAPSRLTPGHFSAPAALTAGRWIFDIRAVTRDGDTLLASFAQTIGAASP